eukprot:m.30036 g.30036  ORF g.30036 m.30036 type:complete len:176 (+) comp9231_c1_seq1:213-740(+)
MTLLRKLGACVVVVCIVLLQLPGIDGRCYLSVQRFASYNETCTGDYWYAGMTLDVPCHMVRSDRMCQRMLQDSNDADDDDFAVELCASTTSNYSESACIQFKMPQDRSTYPSHIMLVDLDSDMNRAPVVLQTVEVLLLVLGVSLLMLISHRLNHLLRRKAKDVSINATSPLLQNV